MKNNKKQEFISRIYKYALNIIKYIDDLEKNSQTKILSDQLLRSGTSVTANIVEAQSASSKKDYINFYNHSLKSANETKLWICLLRDSNKADKQESNKLLDETKQIANIIASSILTMRGKR